MYNYHAAVDGNQTVNINIMNDKQTKALTSPELPDLLRALKNDIFSSLNCAKVGEIQSFDRTKKTAEIKILLKRVIKDKVVSYPLLVDCPVFTLQGGGGAVYMPIDKGNPCLVLFADRSIDTWYSTGSEAAPANNRCHDLSDGIAFVGISSLVSVLDDYPANEARIAYSGARMGIKSGKVNIQNATASLLQALSDLILGIQGATYGGYPFTDTSGKIAIAKDEIEALLFKD
jgi:hypothetical protein